MMLLPFDREKAEAGAKVVTRDGREVRALRYFEETAGNHDGYCIAASVRQFPNRGHGFEIILYRADGTEGDNDPYTALHLVAKDARVYWVNLYHGGQAQWQLTEESADEEERRRVASSGVLASRMQRLHGRAMRVEVREAGPQ